VLKNLNLRKRLRKTGLFYKILATVFKRVLKNVVIFLLLRIAVILFKLVAMLAKLASGAPLIRWGAIFFALIKSADLILFTFLIIKKHLNKMLLF